MPYSLHFTLSSVIHFEIIVVKCRKSVSRCIFFYMWMSSSSSTACESTHIFKQCVFSILADVTFGRSERSPHTGKKEEEQMQSRRKKERNYKNKIFLHWTLNKI